MREKTFPMSSISSISIDKLSIPEIVKILKLIQSIIFFMAAAINNIKNHQQVA